MKKIDISLVKKYVNGEDLGEFTSEQLENDKDFMMGVISYTNDIKMYSFCSESVKQNYEFIKYLVLKFKDNSEFITTVADNYLNNTNTDWESKELSIIMENVLPREVAEKYQVLNETSYYTKRVEIEIAKAKDSNLESMIGEGFLLIFDSYNCSDIILKYYAESMINEIINDNNINFETMLHHQFKVPNEIDEVGVNNYIINFIGYYDSMLSSYISTHLDLIDNIRNKIKSIQINWNKYNMVDEIKRYNSMLGMVHDYMGISESNMSETDILYYVAKELGIKDKVEYYDNPYPLGDEFSFDFDEEVIDDIVEFELENSLKERLVYLNIRKIMLNQLFCSKPTDLHSIIGVEENKKYDNSSKCKIIKLKPKDKK